MFGISTGRDVPSVKRLFGKWGIGGLVDMVVGSNGGEIYDYKTDYYEENCPSRKPDRKYHGAL